MKVKNKNIFLSCAYTNSSNLTIFDKKKRIEQLLSTFESCHRIEDHINIVSEGSILEESELFLLQKEAIILQNHLNEINTLGNKSYGSLLLWLAALKELEIDKNSDVYFLSGRYRLTEDFRTEDFQGGDYVFKKHWYSEGRGGWYGTQLFKVSGKVIPRFIEVLEYCKKYIHIMDIECSLYRSFYDLRIIPTEIPMVNCIGEIGTNNQSSLH